MKKLFIVSFATLGFVACGKKADHVILSGKIDGYMGMPVELIGGTERHTLNVKSDGTFADTLTISTNYYNLLVQQTAMVPLYLQKGDELGINISLEKVTFSGKDTIIQVFLREKNKKINETRQNLETILSEELDGFKTTVADIKKQNDEFLANYKGLPKEFVKLEEKSNHYFDLQLKALYPRVKSQFSGRQIEMPAEFKAELDKVDYTNETDFELFETYKSLVMENFFGKYMMNQEPDWKAMAEEIQAVKPAKIRSVFAEQLVFALNPQNGSETNEFIYKVIKDNVTKEDYLKHAEQLYAELEKLKSLKAGVISPKFEYENFKGGKTSLDDLKGKLVYIDIWATWCKPCLNEIPALQALEKEFHGKDIAFVSISIDQDKDKWLGYMKENKLQGIQLYAEMTTEGQNFIQDYSVSSIPRFILLDKEGKIISADAPRPSSPEIKELLVKNL